MYRKVLFRTPNFISKFVDLYASLMGKSHTVKLYQKGSGTALLVHVVLMEDFSLKR